MFIGGLMAEKVMEFADLIGIAVGAGLGYVGGPIGAIAGAIGGYFASKEVVKRTGHSSRIVAKYEKP